MEILFNRELLADRLLQKQQLERKSVRTSAKEIGISPSTLSRLNRQSMQPDIVTFIKCLDWLGMNHVNIISFLYYEN